MPENLREVPAEILEFLSGQLSVSPEFLGEYGSRPQTRTDHLKEIEVYLGFHKMTSAEEAEIDNWLSSRAAEHDRLSSPQLLVLS